MDRKFLLALWGVLFAVCAAMGFVSQAQGVLWVLLAVLGLVFFAPPVLLLHRAKAASDCSTALLVRNIAVASLVLTLVLLVANVLSWFLAVGFAYLTNRKWVFDSQAKGNAVWAEVVGFYGGRLLTLGMEEGILLAFATLLGFNSTAVKLVAQVAVLIGNYIISKFLIFRKKAAE